MTDVEDGRRRRPSLRQRSRSSHARPSQAIARNLPDHAPDSVRAGLQSATRFQTMDSTEEVAEWLQAIGMAAYIPVFRAQSVTGRTLLSLNSAELRKTLGVTKLKDRRIFLDSIGYLKQALGRDTRTTIPEDGRILTHLSNERLFLVWLRFSIVMQTVALASLRLTNLSNEKNDKHVTLVSATLAALAIIAMVYGTARYYRMHRMIEEPGRDFLPEKVVLLLPTLFLFVGAVVALYALMSHSTEEAAILALLSA